MDNKNHLNMIKIHKIIIATIIDKDFFIKKLNV